MSEHDDDRPLDLPMEPVGGDPIDLDAEVLPCAGVVVRAAVAPTPLGNIAIVLLDFAKADGSGFLPPVMLQVDGKTGDDLPRLIAEGITLARQAALG